MFLVVVKRVLGVLLASFPDSSAQLFFTHKKSWAEEPGNKARVL